MRRIELNGAWEFRKAGDDHWHRAKVPGCNFTDLMAAGIIDDPFVGDNERRVRWVAEADWEYRRCFDVPVEMLERQRQELAFDCLDTLATVTLNGELVGTSDNMFIPNVFRLRPGLLKPRGNALHVRLDSPIRYAKSFDRDSYARQHGCAIIGGCHVRKAACQFGWDWGPQLPPAGISGPVHIVGRDGGRLADVRVSQRHRAGKVSLTLDMSIERWDHRDLRVVASLRSPGGEKDTKEKAIASNRHESSLRFMVDRPALWWPNGYGNHPLYELTVSLIDGEGVCLDRQVRPLGLRTLKLRRRKDRHGESFTFVVNGVEIFCKGANWIPADSFPTRLTKDDYLRLIGDAAAAHMNMLRVWGGGFYEPEWFYDVCDELGVLVWQDFMFACGVYRADEQFIENVHVESVAAMRRLRHHPSLVLWCGNNEMEWFWDVRWKGRIPGTAREAYNTLFHNLLPQWVEEEDPATPYWPSSPSSGEPFVDPNGESRGDGHYWEVWHGRKPFTDYRNRYFRFMSEFGFQALPPIETIATFAPRGEQNMTSYVMECHQKNAAGNGLIVYYLTNNFRLPKSFEALCDVTQILQAEAMRYGVEHWRRNRRLCSGTLYWQLNDCWPVASWASIDYFGRWKALHYAARRFYAPVHLSAEEERHQVGLHVTNDLRKPFRGTVVWSLQTLGGLKLSEGRENVEAAAEANTPVARLDFSEFLDGDLSREAWLVFELRDATGARQALEAVPFAPFKHLKLENPRLTAQLNSAHQRCRITISAQRAAAFVHVRLRGIDTVFSDNFFHLPAGGECVVTCAKPSGHKMEDLRYRLRVTSLWDTF